MTDLELLIHKPSKWAFVGVPLYALGALMLASPLVFPTPKGAEWVLMAVLMSMGLAILVGAIIAFAGYEGIIVRTSGRRIQRWRRLFGYTRRQDTKLSGDELVIVRPQRARHASIYLVMIARDRAGFTVDKFDDVESARKLADELATRLELKVRDEAAAAS